MEGVCVKLNGVFFFLFFAYYLLLHSLAARLKIKTNVTTHNIVNSPV